MTSPDSRTTPRRERPTIEDVATAAGVSVATVSRALRNLPNVADSTRARVRAAAEQLEYRPDPAASRLATGRSRSVGVVVPFLNGWYFSNVVAGVEAVCGEAGYDTIVMGVGEGTEGSEVLDRSAAIHRRVDAIIFVDVSLTSEEIRALDEANLVVVSVGRELPDTPSVGIDDIEVGRIAAQHLLDLGHRRIGLVQGPEDDPFGFVVPHRRRQGFEQALRDAGIEPDPALYAAGNFTMEGGLDALDELMKADDPPTAVFALADEMAFGVIYGAELRGIRIPDDISLIGVDDHDLSPVVGLTTVHQDVPEHGARAARLVVDRLEGETPIVGREVADVRLVVRRTTAAPRIN